MAKAKTAGKRCVTSKGKFVKCSSPKAVKTITVASGRARKSKKSKR